MRHILLATLSTIGIAARIQSATGQARDISNNATPRPIMCVPRSDALSQEVVQRGLAVRLCVQTDILVTLAGGGAALAKAVHSYAPYPAANGSNADPTGITCRRDTNVSASNQTLTCAYNSYWSKQEADARAWEFHNQGPPAPYIGGQ